MTLGQHAVASGIIVLSAPGMRLRELGAVDRCISQPSKREAIHRLVFLDETGTTTKMTRRRGRARRGARLKADAPFGHWATQTFIAGLRCDGLTAPWVVDQPMNRQIFEPMSRPSSPRRYSRATW